MPLFKRGKAQVDFCGINQGQFLREESTIGIKNKKELEN